MVSRIKNPIEIIGGGLAGLSLGLALRREGVAVTLYEAANYPRHRVCGEFIAGLDGATRARLGLDPLLAGALELKTVGWFARGDPIRTQTLPETAFGLSRYMLDARLAAAFVAAGGNLQVKSRIDPIAAEGRVLATGRRIAHSQWVGLKLHAQGLASNRDLEVHLGRHAYVGLSRIEGGAVNICGLFRRCPERAPRSQRSDLMLSYLEACGLSALAARLRASDIDSDSFCAVAALGFQRPRPATDRIEIGDAHALIPPFTGNGMAMAFQSSVIALDPLLAYARGELAWLPACGDVAAGLERRFRTRLVSANFLHPFFHQPLRQGWLSAASRLGVLPVGPIYHLTH